MEKICQKCLLRFKKILIILMKSFMLITKVQETSNRLIKYKPILISIETLKKVIIT